MEKNILLNKHFYVYLFFTGIVWLQPAFGRGSAIKIYDTRCQHKVNPAGVAEIHPNFGWKLASDKRGVTQYAYRILVASSREKLDHEPDLWDSKQVISSQNTFIRYDGKALSGAQKYYWKVRVWASRRDSSVWSDAAYFITGIFSPGEWNSAQWIAYERLPDSLRLFPGDPDVNRPGNTAVKRAVIPYFRHSFFIRKPVSGVYAFVCGLGQYELYLNGQKVSKDFLDPAWSDYTIKCFYNSFDITSGVRMGENTAGAIVGTGFMYINKERYRKLVIAEGYPMLRMKIVIRYRDGSTEEVVTDGKWKTFPSPVVYSGIYGGENYDARLRQPGWDQPGFNDKSWKEAVPVNGPGGAMQSQEDYPLRVSQVFRPVKIEAANAQMRIYDFGQNCSGIIRLNVKGPRGYRIRITPAEWLDKKGLPDQHATGHPYYFSYTLKGNGVESWQPAFSYYGFRYAGVEVFAPDGQKAEPGQAVQIRELLLLHTQNAAPQTGTFACSDTLYNKIFELIHWSIRSNMASVATDCPHREKLGWLEQSHLMGPSIRYDYDILRFYHKIIDDMRGSQLPNGLVPDIAPEYVIFSDGFRDSPEWGSACILLPWYVYEWYGDKEVLEKSYPMMEKYLSYLDTKAQDHLLFYGLGDWLAVPRPETPEGLTASAFYFYDAVVLEKTAKVLGDSVRMHRFDRVAQQIRAAFNRKFFNAVTCVYGSGSQTSYGLPLYLGITEDQYKNRVVNNFIRSVISGGDIQTAGDVGNRFMIQALARNGASWLVNRIEHRMDTPGYGYQLTKGATALAESWDASHDLSNDHIGMGHLMEWLYGGLAGIRQQPGSTGFKHILIAPQFVKGMKWVKCSYNSMNGKIAVQWKVTQRHVQLKVAVPVNSSARIEIPAADDKKIRENGKPVAESGKIKMMARADNKAALDIGSGSYMLDFDLPASYDELDVPFPDRVPAK